MCAPRLAVCRSCAETLHFYVRATTEAVAHCAPCSEVSSSRSFVVLLVFVCGAAFVVVLAVLLKKLPAKTKQHLNEFWNTTTKIYRL